MPVDPSCLFCKFVSGNLNPDTVYEDNYCLAFRDNRPQAPTHILLIPKSHIPRLDTIRESDRAMAGHLLERAAYIAKEAGLSKGGFRIVVNCGFEAGQAVNHLHLHILGGRKFTWPPG
ncbi:MAG: histidine triad nucleotide-binding protein [Planctomycetota bacterium]